jgi:hypothetical protein
LVSYFTDYNEGSKKMKRNITGYAKNVGSSERVGVNEAAWRFNIHKTTLKRRISGKLMSLNTSVGHPMDLPVEVEDDLVHHLHLEEMFYRRDSIYIA